MLSIFSDGCFIISASCAAEDACNGEGGGSSAGRRSVRIIFSSSFFKESGKSFSNSGKQPLSNIRGGKLGFRICCPSSQNKTRPLEVRGEGGQNQAPPVSSSGGMTGLDLGGLKLTVSEGC